MTNSFFSDINAFGVQELTCSCTSSNLSLFFLGLILGLSPVIIYLIINTLKKKKHRVPSSPHYITAESNSYIAVPVRDRSLLKKQHSYNGNGTIKPKFDFDFVSTLKRNSNEMKHGHAKQYYPSDKHLYE